MGGGRKMAGTTSLDAVKRKIKHLQDQTDCAGERAEKLQRDLCAERKAKEQVSMFGHHYDPLRSSSRVARVPLAMLPARVFSRCSEMLAMLLCASG